MTMRQAGCHPKKTALFGHFHSTCHELLPRLSAPSSSVAESSIIAYHFLDLHEFISASRDAAALSRSRLPFLPLTLNLVHQSRDPGLVSFF